ncbi:MAG: toxin-antitoxin system HicB family antitoxin [Candidatus Gracilibacteria bacterium]|nr:toxin-antitoxin system HicB family antitoxin [Candidatus Gracilibacteria bacterium]
MFPYNYLIQPIREGEEIAYRAFVPKFPEMIILAESPTELHEITVSIVEEEIKKRKKAGKTIPEPDLMGKYNGKILFRTSPQNHEKLVIEATARNISLNKLLEEKIIGS